MGAYTWTFIRVDKVSKEESQRLVRIAIRNAESTSYAKYSKMPWDEALKDWLEFHQEDMDYLMNELHVPLEELTEDYLSKELQDGIAEYQRKIQLYNDFLNDKLSFVDMLQTAGFLNDEDGAVGDFYIIKRGEQFYICCKSEIFRFYKYSFYNYSDGEFSTVEDLMNYIKQFANDKSFIDFENGDDYDVLTHELEDRIRKHYTEIGDGNFIVHFG